MMFRVAGRRGLAGFAPPGGGLLPPPPPPTTLFARRRSLACLAHRGRSPVVAADALVAVTATLVGEVTVGPESSVWYNCALRADVAPIVIGARTNVQDGTVIHVASADLGKRGALPTVIGDDVTIGHMALLHACTVQDRAFVGMGAVVMDGALVASDSMLAAGSLLPAGRETRPGELWAGRPAKLMRELDAGEIKFILHSAATYVGFAKDHRDVKL